MTLPPSPGVAPAFNRKALIDILTRRDDDLEEILAKPPGDLTEDEVRRVTERRLALPPGPEKEALFRFEQAFYDDAFGTDAAVADGTGRLISPSPRRSINSRPVAARTADGQDLARALHRLAGRVADVAEANGRRDAVKFLQRGLNALNRALTEAGTDRPLFADLKDDGDPGPKTRGALRAITTRLGPAKAEEALALGRFDALLRAMARGEAAGDLRGEAEAAFARLFRDPRRPAAGGRTEEGESIQMAVNDLGTGLLNADGFRPLREDGVIGPVTKDAFRRVLAASGPDRMLDAVGRNLGFYLFDPRVLARRT